MKAKFFYDGNCDFCSGLADYWKLKTDTKQIDFLSFRDYSESELLKFHSQLTWDKCEGNVQLIYGNSRLPGFFGVRRMLFWTKYKYLAPILYLPLVPFLGVAVMYFLRFFKSKK
ncbi:DCC1-like thiol-disulfide oxidoreductase family protein [Leptospira ilyithenensis]|uniref:DUF393 domain-containing protein n=1 Tax=Leptospira ilyithenensis TaxID=2484901 RepID=A0A4R9LQA9_9LEPT|nr:DCC1-like thiol-disulfide oxidoreductase family protein [Leptospira ilyithenensis]TGN08381.1 DUF393 domain-containing protein [Leptospira ilyithenensis]